MSFDACCLMLPRMASCRTLRGRAYRIQTPILTWGLRRRRAGLKAVLQSPVPEPLPSHAADIPGWAGLTWAAGPTPSAHTCFDLIFYIGRGLGTYAVAHTHRQVDP